MRCASVLRLPSDQMQRLTFGQASHHHQVVNGATSPLTLATGEPSIIAVMWLYPKAVSSSAEGTGTVELSPTTGGSPYGAKAILLDQAQKIYLQQTPPFSLAVATLVH